MVVNGGLLWALHHVILLNMAFDPPTEGLRLKLGISYTFDLSGLSLVKLN